jgi:hypothetical protein
MNSASGKLFPILASIFGLIYMAGFAIPLFLEEEISGTENITVLGMFLFFAAGVSVSWFNEKAGGLLIQLWHVGIWFCCFFLWPDSGMIIILVFPGLVIGILMLLSGYKTSGDPKPTRQLQWKFILRVLMINFAVLYVIAMIDDFIDDEYLDYLTMPFLLYPVLFIVFASACITSWRYELAAGSLFVLWYIIILFGTFVYSSFSNQGPWIIVGVVTLVLGIFNIYYHYRYKRKFVTVNTP